MLSALGTYSRILDLLARLPTVQPQVAQLQVIVGEIHQLFDDSANFGSEGRSMKREAAKEWSTLSDRFDSLRQALRQAHKTP